MIITETERGGGQEEEALTFNTESGGRGGGAAHYIFLKNVDKVVYDNTVLIYSCKSQGTVSVDVDDIQGRGRQCLWACGFATQWRP